MDPEERFYREALADLHKSYLKAAQPIVDALARIEAYKPPRPILLTLEEARLHGFIQ